MTTCNEHTEQLSFLLRGADFTRLMHDLVLEHRWRDALRILQENMLPRMTYEQACDVLSGKLCMNGDSRVGIELVRDRHSREYKQQLAYIYGGAWYDHDHDRYFQPYARVFGWCELDLHGPRQYVNTLDDEDDDPGPTRMPLVNKYIRNNLDPLWRSLFYLDDVVNDRLAYAVLSNETIVVAFEELSSVPPWVQTYDTPQAALDAWLPNHVLGHRGADQYSDEINERAKRRECWRHGSTDKAPVARAPVLGTETVVDEYLRDPDATMARLAQDMNRNISKATGTYEGDHVYGPDMNGWLSPTGEFSACEYGAHVPLAQQLGASSTLELEQRGFCTLSKGVWLVGVKRLTQAQAAYIRNWCSVRGIEPPEEATGHI